MFFPEDVERQLLHNSKDRSLKFNGKPLIKSFNNATTDRNIGGSYDGVSTLKPAKLMMSSSMSGGMSGGKKTPNKWQLLIKKTMTEQNLSMKDAIKYIKNNNLY